MVRRHALLAGHGEKDTVRDGPCGGKVPAASKGKRRNHRRALTLLGMHGADGRHVWNCRAGAAKLRTHRHVEHALAVMIRQSGGTADLERPIPSMSQRREDGSIREAILDVQIMFPGVLRVWNVDVSVRSAVSERYGCKKLDPQHALRLACKENTTDTDQAWSPLFLALWGESRPRQTWSCAALR